MRKAAFFLSVFTFFAALSVFSETSSEDTKEKKFQVSLGYNHEQSSSWYLYDTDGQQSLMEDLNVIATIDSTERNDLGETIYDTTFREYASDFFRNSFILDFSWTPNRFLKLQAEVPVSFYKEEEQYDQSAVYDPYTGQTLYSGGEPKANHSRTRIDYIGLSCEGYFLNTKKVKLGSTIDLRLPTGTDDSALRDEFLSDGKFETYAGIISEVRGRASRFQTRFIYNYRAEEYSDRFLFSSLIGLSTVKNSELQLLMMYGKSLEDYKPEFAFSPTKEILWGDFFDFGFNFKLDFFENYTFSGGYRLSLWGRNTSNPGIFQTRISYRF
jgi:hypothetical protein